MPTRRLAIKEVKRGYPIWIVKPDDFVYEEGEEIDPEIVLNDPSFTLYCLDPKNDLVLFIESDDPAAVDAAPFYYQAQVEHAKALVAMPTETFHQIGAKIPEPKKGLIWVHSVGRCGSTLVSKALAAVPQVHSLSEPDDLTQMVILRVGKGFADDWLREMISSSIRWRCKKRIGSDAEFVAIKPRSEVMVLADLLGSLFPHSKHLFLYRNAVPWMQSYFAGYPPERDVYDAEMNLKSEEGWSEALPLMRENRREGSPMNAIEIRTLGWITSMEGYFTLRDLEVPLRAVRFEDLTARPVPVLKKMFDFFGVDKVDWEAVEEVLGRDSQAGTVFSREERRKNPRILTPEMIEDVKDLVATRPLLGRPDVILDGTILPE